MTRRMTFDCYSHGVRASGFDDEIARFLAGFADRLLLRDYSQDRFGQTIETIKKAFYGYCEKTGDYFFHRHHLEDLKNYLRNLNFTEQHWVENHHEAPAAAPSFFRLKDSIKPRAYQTPIVDKLADDTHTTGLKLFTGYGKAQPLTSKILTPQGWSTMGDMSVGQEVIAGDGTTSTITGVYPQGEVDIYQVTFADGRQTECCGEHLWTVYQTNATKDKRWKTVTTLEIKRLQTLDTQVFIPLYTPRQGEHVDLPLDPYLLGVLLGVGGFTAETPHLSNPEQAIVEQVTTLLPTSVQLTPKGQGEYHLATPSGQLNPLTRILRRLGLMDKHARETHVPEMYLSASLAQRSSLIQGILDTVGDIHSHDGTIAHTTTSPQLADDVQYLIRSLGGIAQKHNGCETYTLTVQHPEPATLVSLPHKQKRVGDGDKRLKLRVDGVALVSRQQAQCIRIDHPDRLYVTDDFTVTHNTLCALMAVQKRQQRTVLMISPKYFGIWRREFEDSGIDMHPGRWREVSGTQQLRDLQEDALNGELTEDFIMISSITYRTYIEGYERFGDDITEMGYCAPPYRFHELIGAGVQINDEFQDDPGLVFRIDLYTNVQKQIYLSATPFTGSDYVTKMIEVMTPPHLDCPLPDYEAYINVVALTYSDADVKPKDYTSSFKRTYNHARFEKRLMRAKRRMNRYLKMVGDVLNVSYVKERQPGQKALVLCSTKDFIVEVTNYLIERFPDLDVGYHVSGCDYKRLAQRDVTVSTIKSAGTGVDIRNLKEILLCQAVDSKKDNIQILGRLRPVKDYPEITPRLTYLVCVDIPAQVRYANNKLNHFRGRVLNSRKIRYG